MNAPPAPTSRPYKIALTVAITLLLLLLTGALLAMILSDAAEQDRAEALSMTLTQAFAILNQTATALAPPPTDSPPVQWGEFPFAARGGTAFSAANTCGAQIMRGDVLGQDGSPLDGLQVALWGDYVDPQLLLTGALAEQAPGQWAAALEGNINRRVWVQLLGDQRTLSAPVEIVFGEGDCARNLARVSFQQVGELP